MKKWGIAALSILTVCIGLSLPVSAKTKCYIDNTDGAKFENDYCDTYMVKKTNDLGISVSFGNNSDDTDSPKNRYEEYDYGDDTHYNLWKKWYLNAHPDTSYVIRIYRSTIKTTPSNKFSVDTTIMLQKAKPDKGPAQITVKIPTKYEMVRRDGTKRNVSVRISDIQPRDGDIKVSQVQHKKDAVEVTMTTGGTWASEGYNKFNFGYVIDYGQDTLPKADEIFHYVLDGTQQAPVYDASFSMYVQPQPLSDLSAKAEWGAGSKITGFAEDARRFNDDSQYKNEDSRSNTIMNFDKSTNNSIEGDSAMPLNPEQKLLIRAELPNHYFIFRSFTIESLFPWSLAIVSAIAIVIAIILLTRSFLSRKSFGTTHSANTDRQLSVSQLSCIDTGLLYDGWIKPQSAFGQIIELANKGYIDIAQAGSPGSHIFLFKKRQEYTDGSSVQAAIMKHLFDVSDGNDNQNGRIRKAVRAAQKAEYASDQAKLTIRPHRTGWLIARIIQLAAIIISLAYIAILNKNKAFAITAIIIVLVSISAHVFISMNNKLKGGVRKLINVVCALAAIIGIAITLVDFQSYLPEGSKQQAISWGYESSAEDMYNSFSSWWTGSTTEDSKEQLKKAQQKASGEIRSSIIRQAIDSKAIIASFIASIIAIVLLQVYIIYSSRKTETARQLRQELQQQRQQLLFVDRQTVLAIASKNPQYYYDVLPYAYALGMQRDWSLKFAGTGLPKPSWLISDDNTLDDIALFRLAPSYNISDIVSKLSSKQYRSLRDILTFTRITHKK